VHFFLISQRSLFLVIEYDSEFWPVAWIQSDATVSPRLLSLIFFVCTYGGVSRGNFSLLQMASKLSHFQTNRGKSLIQSFLGTYVDRWYLLNCQILTFTDDFKIKSFSNRWNSLIKSLLGIYEDRWCLYLTVNLFNHQLHSEIAIQEHPT